MLRITQLHARCWDGWDMRAATRDWCPMLKLGAAGTKHPDDATRSPPALSYCAMLRCAVAALLLRCCCCAVAAVLCCCSAAVPCGGVLRALTRHHPYHTFALFIIAIMSNCVSMPRGRHCGYDGRVVGVGDLLRPRRHARYVQCSTVGSTVQSAVRTAAIDDGLLNEISSPRGACNVRNGRYRPAGSERLPAAACHAGVRPSRRYGRTA
jgi:hypothetical protein